MKGGGLAAREGGREREREHQLMTHVSETGEKGDEEEDEEGRKEEW